MAEKSDLGARVKALRDTLGLTQEQLARKAKVTLSNLSQIERGVIGNPRVDTVRRLAAVLGVRWEELLGDVPPAEKEED